MLSLTRNVELNIFNRLTANLDCDEEEALSSDSSADSDSQASEMDLLDKFEFLKNEQEKIREIFCPHEANHKIVISVVDSGVGLTIEEQSKLFRLFGTVRRTKSLNTKGVGLGLSISKMISNEFGGDVAIKSKVGIGAAFLSSMQLNAAKTEQQKSEEEKKLETKL